MPKDDWRVARGWNIKRGIEGQEHGFSRPPEPGADGPPLLPIEEFIGPEDFPLCLQGRYVTIGEMKGEVVNVGEAGSWLILRVSSAERRLVGVEEDGGQFILRVSSPDQRGWDLEFVIPKPGGG